MISTPAYDLIRLFEKDGWVLDKETEGSLQFSAPATLVAKGEGTPLEDKEVE